MQLCNNNKRKTLNQINFTKMHGLGNDFIVLDYSNKPSFNLTVEQMQLLANRKYGIGCDQILVIETSTQANVDYLYTIFNADGSHANNCGNGARCIIKYLYSKYKNLPAKLSLQLKDRLIVGSINQDESINVNMGHPYFKPSKIPFLGKANSTNLYQLNYNHSVIDFGIISMGNPHAVIKLDNLRSLTPSLKLKKLAQFVQNSGLFPQGVNVNFYYQNNKQNISVLTYERGVGFTDACGTGACAVACYTINQKACDAKVKISMPGGNLTIFWQKDQEIIMTGPAVEVYTGTIKI
jgi:diaminopimelate epimerase